MSAVLITFKEIPRFGFAHHIYTEKTHQIQNDIQHSFVLVYVKSGCLIAKVYERIIKAPAGSILVLFRHMPFQLFSEQDTHQDYCSIQVFTDYTFDILEDNDDYPANFAGLALPFIVPAGNEAEQIKKDMLSIIAWLSISREAYSFGAAMTMCGILHRLDTFYRQKLHQGKRASYWENKIKRYVADHIQFPISLEDIGTFLGKSPQLPKQRILKSHRHQHPQIY